MPLDPISYAPPGIRVPTVMGANSSAADPFPFCNSNEVRGAPFSVDTIADRDNHHHNLRQWGQTCYVVNDPQHPGYDPTYPSPVGFELVNSGDNDLANNANWLTRFVSESNEQTIATHPVGEIISALRAVRLENGLLYYASADNLTNSRVFGVSLTAANPTNTSRVKLSGIMNFPNTFTSNILFLGNDGYLVESPEPSNEIVIQVGRVLSPNEVYVSVEDYIVVV